VHIESLEDSRKRKRRLSEGIVSRFPSSLHHRLRPYPSQDERSPPDVSNSHNGRPEPLRNSSFTTHLANPSTAWDPSSTFQFPRIQHQNNAHSSMPTDAPAVAPPAHPVAQSSNFVEPNFNTDDASLLEFFRYGLAEWPDSTNIWPPINDFGPGAG
jgi:hypothetical protein